MTTPTPPLVNRCVRRICAAIAVATLVALPLSAAAPRFYPDDPIAREPDPADASHVQPFPVHLSWDMVSSLFMKEGDPKESPARNINTTGEVPDSSWFTNRVGTLPLTEADVARGPDTTEGPMGRWTVVSGKSEGVEPGFTIVDSAGVKWFVKFDAPGHPEVSTGAEAVSTKLFWALGYNVVETHVATLQRTNLAVSREATITVGSRKRRFTAADVDRVLALVERSPDGTYRAFVSRAAEGKVVGEFLYYGTRADDPNDIVPHENRRELRGLRVFAAWLSREDAKPGNTLDTLVTVSGHTVVRHYLLDFASTLGSPEITQGPEGPWQGHEYLYEGKPLLKKLLGFGLPIEDWRRIDYPDLKGVGHFEGEHFDPESWKSYWPNAAYLRAEPDDNFWAARKVMAVTDGMIAAAVKTGKYSDPAAEAYLTRTIIKRRDAIGRAYLSKVNPIVSPSLNDAGLLTFNNAAVESAGAAAPASYRATWSRFDNATDRATPLGDSTGTGATALQAPSTLPREAGAFVRVEISAMAQANRAWATPVHAYFRRDPNAWTLVGLER